MTMHIEALHPRDDKHRPYVLRKEGRRRIASIKDSVDASIPEREQRKTYHSDQKQYRQHKDQQNNNN